MPPSHPNGGAPRPGPRRSPRSAQPADARRQPRPHNGRPAAARPTAAPVSSPADRLPPRQAPAGPPATTFAELDVPAPIVAALARLGVVTPFPIQAASMASSLSGRDVLGRGRTGSGKTVAFAVPVVAALAASGRTTKPGRPRALILVPTRELAVQVAAVLEPLAASMGQRVSTIYGGVGQAPQVAALKRGVDIIVACPGRLEDLIGQRHCALDAVEICVLDEADHLADLGFLPVVKKLLDRTPTDGQRLLFSATLDRGVDAVVRRYLRNPVTHSVDEVDEPPPMLEHHAFTVEPGDKAAVVRELASGVERSLLFTRTKHAAKKLARQLADGGVPAVDLHGNLSQPQRLRNLAAFADGSVRVLVATDIAARGIHVDDIALVVHVDPPSEHKAYLHRSGRTARAGAAGVVVTVVTPAQEGEVRALVRLAGIRPAAAKVRPGDPRTLALTGPAAPVRYLTVPAPAPQVARPPRVGRTSRPAHTQGRSQGRRR